MPYTTQAEIVSRRIPEDDLIQLTDDDSIGVVDAAIVASIISEVDEVIDGYLRQRYQLPLASVPGFLTGLAVDLCAYALYERRAHVDTPEKIEKAAERARRQLREIQRGELDLGLADNSTSGGSGASFSADERKTGRENMKGLL